MTNAQRVAVAILLMLGLIGALWSARSRVAVERANRTVALCVDDLEVRQLAALTGQAPAALMAQLKQAGATHVAVSERTLGELLQTGELRMREEASSRWIWGALSTVMPVATRLEEAGFYGVQTRLMGSGNVLPAPPVLLTMPRLGLLYDREVIGTISNAGLGVVARPMPDYLLTPQAVEASLAAARDIGAQTVLFNGVSVAGGPKMAKQTAEIMRRLGLQFGFVELVPQDGAANLAGALNYQIIRTHSISQEEMVKTPPSRGLDRFTLAVTERGVRLCYVRLLLNPQAGIVDANVAYLSSIRDGLGKAGYGFGDPQPFQPLSVPAAALALMALGVVGGGLWLVMEMLRPRDCWFWGLGIVGVIVALGGFAAPSLVQALFPLLAAIIFPTLAVLFVASVAGRTSGGAGKAAGLVIVAAAVTVLGGLLSAGMLSSSPYMMQIAQFRGVKLAQLLPLVLVLAVMVGRTFAVTGEGWPGLRRGLTTAAEAFVKYWHALAVVAILGLVAFMIMRSGNESAVEVSSLELRLRALLDQILIVRPRTKEILFGFPALLLGLTLLLQRRPRTVWLWLTFGVIGLISLTNTFAHLHTPLGVSLLRVVNGIWVGILVGFLWLAAKWIGERLLRIIWPAGYE